MGQLLSVRGLCLSFAGVTALSEVSLELEDGELVALIGPNGAGKTSLFNCISGLYAPQAGEIDLHGEGLLRQPPHRRAGLGVARVFQNLALYEHLTVLENLMVGRHHLYRTGWWHDVLWTPRARREEVRHRRQVEGVIDFLDLEGHRDSIAGVLPYGVLKRVELGRALCLEPTLLLLDEPAAGLNQEETEDMARYILDIKEELGITQILIEHDLHLVLDLADRVVVLDFGRKIAEGSPEQVARHPEVARAYAGSTQDANP